MASRSRPALLGSEWPAAGCAHVPASHGTLCKQQRDTSACPPAASASPPRTCTESSLARLKAHERGGLGATARGWLLGTGTLSRRPSNCGPPARGLTCPMSVSAWSSFHQDQGAALHCLAVPVPDPLPLARPAIFTITPSHSLSPRHHARCCCSSCCPLQPPPLLHPPRAATFLA